MKEVEGENMSGILFLLGILTMAIGVFFAFFTGHLVGFLLSVIGAVAGGMILIALGQILENQEINTHNINLINKKVDQLMENDLPTSACPECGYTYKGNQKRCPNCYITFNAKNP